MDERKIRFLVVEDNEDHAELVRQTLRGNQVETEAICVSSGESALQFLRREGDYEDAQTPDVVLLDINLPGISGLEVLKIVKEDPQLKTIPIVVLTSSGAEADKKKAYAYGANSYVVKPFGYKKFKQMITELRIYWGVWNSNI